MLQIVTRSIGVTERDDGESVVTDAALEYMARTVIRRSLQERGRLRMILVMLVTAFRLPVRDLLSAEPAADLPPPIALDLVGDLLAAPAAPPRRGWRWSLPERRASRRRTSPSRAFTMVRAVPL